MHELHIASVPACMASCPEPGSVMPHCHVLCCDNQSEPLLLTFRLCQAYYFPCTLCLSGCDNIFKQKLLSSWTSSVKMHWSLLQMWNGFGKLFLSWFWRQVCKLISGILWQTNVIRLLSPYLPICCISKWSWLCVVKNQAYRKMEPSVRSWSSPVLPTEFTVFLSLVSVVTDNHLCVFRDSSQEKSAPNLLKGISQFSRIYQRKAIAVCREGLVGLHLYQVLKYVN